MNNTPESVTLASLRAKTDLELIAIIQSKLERGFDLVRRHSNGSAAEAHRAAAKQAHAEAARLLPLVYGLGESERRWLEARLAELQSALDLFSETQARKVRSAGG